MKTTLLLFSIVFGIHFMAQGQSNLLIKGTNVENNKLYLKLQGNTDLRAFVKREEEAGSFPLSVPERFSLKGKNLNVYLKWVNPLRYKLSWTDSTFKDERDLAVNTFISQLVVVFGSPVLNLNKDNAESKAAIARSGLPAPVPGTGLQYPPEGFKSFELTNLYLQLRQQSNPALTPQEITNINSITTGIIVLDNLNAENIAKTANDLFDQLFKITTAQKLEEDLPGVKSDIEQLETIKFSSIESHIQSSTKAVANLSLNDKFLEGHYRNTITRFAEQVLLNLTRNRELIKKFEPIIKILETSIENPGDVPNTTPGLKTDYFKERDINLTDGEGLHTKVFLIENTYDPVKHEFKFISKSDKATLQFRKYDPVVVFASAGGFYSNTKLKGYGVDKELKIIEDDIERENFVTAAFLNFAFGSSRYVSPLLQLGIDPTKRRPFLLAGGGFAIPVAKFAITSGGIWTWEPSLNNLQKGQIISSTTELEKDITFKFAGLSGWYLGVQYNIK